MIPLKGMVKRLLGRRLTNYLLFRRHHRRALLRAGFPNRRVAGEERYVNQWRRLSRWVEPYSYRLYSHYCGATPDIVPEDILHDVIEPVINPLDYWAAYEDKNMFARLVGADILPRTWMCRIGGGPLLDENQRPLTQRFDAALAAAPFAALVLKPAAGSSCGERVMRFDRKGTGYADADGQTLSETLLAEYGNDWVLQECIRQHPFMQRLSPTAVCTIRLTVYRSVNDGKSTITAGVLRVGKDGAIVDNNKAGGCFVGIDVADGRLHRCFIARDGSRYDQWNGVTLDREQHIPCWEAVCALAHRVAADIPHHHLLALDIALCDNEKPMLIEYNIGGFSAYLYHYVGQTVFGRYTDEVIDHVARALR